MRVRESDQSLTVSIDGHSTSFDQSASAESVKLAAIPPHRREHQVDGSDTTNNSTWSQAHFSEFSASPYYQLQALLRDESSYSTWHDLRIKDLDGQASVVQDRPAVGQVIPLPQQFDLAVALHRVETPMAVELADRSGTITRVQVNRNDKYVNIERAARDAPPHPDEDQCTGSEARSMGHSTRHVGHA
jgi:hypothetical protein